MEQIQYEDNFQGVGFDPIKQIDYIPTLDRRNQRLNQADQEALAQVRRNNIVQVKNAENAGKDLEALSKLSGTLSKLVGDISKERQAEQDAEDVAEGFEMYLNGGLDMSEYNSTMGQARQQSQVAADVESDVLGDNGENYEASSAISKSTAFRNANVAKGFAMGAMQEYGTFMESAVNMADYPDRASYLAARRQAMKEFFKRAGISGLKPQFLAETVYPAIARSEARAASAYSKDFAQRDSFIRQDEAVRVLEATNDVAGFLDATRNTVGADGKPLGYRGAWELFDKNVIKLRKAGLLSDSDVEAMKSQVVPGDKKGRTYGELYKARFGDIDRQVSAQARQDWENSEKDRKIEFEQAEQQLVDAFLDSTDADGFTDDQINEAIDTLRNRYGFESRELAILKNSTVDAETRKKQKEQIEDLIAMNLLTPERLKRFDPQLQRTYMAQAQQQAKLAKENGNFDEQETAIKDLVESTANVTRDAASHPSVGLMTAKMQKRFHKYVGELALANNPDPAGEALARVFAEFNQMLETKGFLTQKGYPSAMPQGSGMESAQQADYRIRLIDTHLKSYGNAVLDMPNETLFTTQQLEAMSKGYGEPGFQTDPQLNYIAQELGVDPLTVLNRQRKANGMTELPPSPAIEVMQNQLSPEQQRLLNQFKTPDRSTRGLIGQSQYNPEVIPGGYGKAVQDAASKHGVDPSILAGLIETESTWNPGAISRGGARGLGQFMPDTAAEFGVNVNDPTSSINGAAQYLKYLQDYFNGDMRLAIIAYNGGMGNVRDYGGAIPGNRENQEYYGKVIKAAGKYGYGKQSLADPATFRPSLAYISGNIGPTSTGPHLDVKEVGGGNFAETALDDYVEVDDPDYGRVSLGEIRKRTGGIGDNQAQHRARGSHGVDYGLHEGTKVYVKNGAKVIGSKPSAHGDVVTIELPNGKQYTFLHGNKA